MATPSTPSTPPTKRKEKDALDLYVERLFMDKYSLYAAALRGRNDTDDAKPLDLVLLDFAVLERVARQGKAESPADKAEIARLARALSTDGFFGIKNTCVPQKHIDDMRAMTFRLKGVEFASESDLTQLTSYGKIPAPVGFTIKNGAPGNKRNVWPTTEVVGYQDTYARFYAAMREVEATLLRVCALAYNQPPTFFSDVACARGRGGMVALNYADIVTPKQRKPLYPHTDWSVLTILSPAPGLEVLQKQSGEFRAVPVIPGVLVVNVGDVMQLMTQHTFVSSLHVVRRWTDFERVTMAYFSGQDVDEDDAHLHQETAHVPEGMVDLAGITTTTTTTGVKGKANAVAVSVVDFMKRNQAYFATKIVRRGKL